MDVKYRGINLGNMRYNVIAATFMLLVPMQATLAAFKPIGIFKEHDSGGTGAGVYAIGANEVLLSIEEARIYRRAKNGDAVAQYEFAKLLNPTPHSSTIASQVAAEAFSWAMRSALHGDADGKNYVGVAYKNGVGVGKDKQEAERWLTDAVKSGSAKAMNNLALLYIENGEMEQAVKLARKSALSGCPEGQVQWGRMNLWGEGVPVDKEKAVIWFKKAVKQDNASAMILLAMCYHTGMGTNKNIPQAIELYESVANRKDRALLSTLAKTALAKIYFEEESVNGKSLAVKWAMEALSDNGKAELKGASHAALLASMQYIVGWAYWKGQGVTRNDQQAKKWMEEAYSGGDVRAEIALASITEEIRRKEEIAAQKARAEEEQRRLAEEEREARQYRRAMQEREERARMIFKNAKKEYYEQKAREEWIELHHPEFIESYREFSKRWNAERMRLYQQGYW